MDRLIKIFKILIAITSFIYGINLICVWTYNLQYYEEGNTLEEISLEGIDDDHYVSFYIDDYANKEIYVEGDIEYEIYTILVEWDIYTNTNSYIQVMVKNQETKHKLNNLHQGKVYFEGVVIDAPNNGFNFGKDWDTGVPDGMNISRDELVGDMAIVETEIPSKGYGIYIGIVLIIVSIIIYRKYGGIQGCVPNIDIKPNKYEEYNSEYNTQIHNIRNEWLNEKDNLKRLKLEQIESKKITNIMVVIFSIGLLLFCSGNIMEFLNSIMHGMLELRVFLMTILVVSKILGLILVLISIGGVWSRFINSSHKMAVYIAHKFEKRSIHLEIEICKKNIEYLERIMEEKNL